MQIRAGDALVHLGAVLLVLLGGLEHTRAVCVRSDRLRARPLGRRVGALQRRLLGQRRRSSDAPLDRLAERPRARILALPAGLSCSSVALHFCSTV